MGLKIREIQGNKDDFNIIQIEILDEFSPSVSEELRKIVEEQLSLGKQRIYLDIQNMEEIDLSVINEIMFLYRNSKNEDQELVLVYKEGGPLEEWLSKTQLDSFVSTARIPKIS